MRTLSLSTDHEVRSDAFGVSDLSCIEKISSFLQEHPVPYLLFCAQACTRAKVSKRRHDDIIQGLHLYLPTTRYVLMPSVWLKLACIEKIFSFLQEQPVPYLLFCAHARTGAKVSKQGHDDVIQGLHVYLQATRYVRMPLVCLKSHALRNYLFCKSNLSPT